MNDHWPLQSHRGRGYLLIFSVALLCLILQDLQSDLVFLEIQRRLKDEPNLARDVNASYQFNITKDGKLSTNWSKISQALD